MNDPTPFDIWFQKTQEIQAGYPGRHPNQAQYDQTLRANYMWPFIHMVPVDVEAGVKLLDVGCAYGTLTLGAQLLGYHPMATDINNEYVNVTALSDRDVEFVPWDIMNPLIGGKPEFDVVVFTEVLEHLDFSPVRALLNIRALMKPGAKLILSTPRYENAKNHIPVQEFHWSCLPWQRENGTPEDRHHHIYTQAELVELLDVCGFNITGGGILWHGLGVGLSAFRSASDTSMDLAEGYCEMRRAQVQAQ